MKSRAKIGSRLLEIFNSGKIDSNLLKAENRLMDKIRKPQDYMIGNVLRALEICRSKEFKALDFEKEVRPEIEKLVDYPKDEAIARAARETLEARPKPESEKLFPAEPPAPVSEPRPPVIEVSPGPAEGFEEEMTEESQIVPDTTQEIPVLQATQERVQELETELRRTEQKLMDANTQIQLMQHDPERNQRPRLFDADDCQGLRSEVQGLLTERSKIKNTRKKVVTAISQLESKSKVNHETIARLRLAIQKREEIFKARIAAAEKELKDLRETYLGDRMRIQELSEKARLSAEEEIELMSLESSMNIIAESAVEARDNKVGAINEEMAGDHQINTLKQKIEDIKAENQRFAESLANLRNDGEQLTDKISGIDQKLIEAGRRVFPVLEEIESQKERTIADIETEAKEGTKEYQRILALITRDTGIRVDDLMPKKPKENTQKEEKS